MRESHPDRYVEIGAKLIAAAEQPPAPGDYSSCKSIEDIGRMLLMQVDVLEEVIDEEMLAKAVSAHEDFIARLRRIGEGR